MKRFLWDSTLEHLYEKTQKWKGKYISGRNGERNKDGEGEILEEEGGNQEEDKTVNGKEEKKPI